MPRKFHFRGFEKIVKHFDRYHRFTLGQDLRNQSRLVAKQVMRIHQSKRKEDIQELLKINNSFRI
ncbi:MAG: hypothetical protein ACMXYK_02730 [Candidatus Woesearchaeota archaeon]